MAVRPAARPTLARFRTRDWRTARLVQAVARLNSTGQRGEDLMSAAEFCVRVIRRLDEAAEHVRRNIP
ncbi:MAG TPA: hypothetical protein VMH35_20645 [Streptosporangiaceae bacterium]|nr:hypothetical protein [Streptosporangiaceae bacterium]